MSFLRRLFGGRSDASNEINAWLLSPARSDAALDIVGEGSYQQALEVISGGRTPDGPAIRDHVAVLIAEPGTNTTATRSRCRYQGSGSGT
jgi:hypothetical protein